MHRKKIPRRYEPCQMAYKGKPDLSTICGDIATQSEISRHGPVCRYSLCVGMIPNKEIPFVLQRTTKFVWSIYGVNKKRWCKNPSSSTLFTLILKTFYSEWFLMSQSLSGQKPYRWSVPKRAVRIFQVPPLNFSAKNCFTITNLNEFDITVPPLLRNLDKEELTNLYKSEIGSKIREIPCHSQAVERNVKLVTEAALSVK